MTSDRIVMDRERVLSLLESSNDPQTAHELAHQLFPRERNISGVKTDINRSLYTLEKEGLVERVKNQSTPSSNRPQWRSTRLPSLSQLPPLPPPPLPSPIPTFSSPFASLEMSQNENLNIEVPVPLRNHSSLNESLIRLLFCQLCAKSYKSPQPALAEFECQLCGPVCVSCNNSPNHKHGAEPRKLLDVLSNLALLINELSFHLFSTLVFDSVK